MWDTVRQHTPAFGIQHFQDRARRKQRIVPAAGAEGKTLARPPIPNDKHKQDVREAPFMIRLTLACLREQIRS